jgi:hypothetical protein
VTVLSASSWSDSRRHASGAARGSIRYASRDSSLGFFDGNDNPPWDTWIADFDGVLVSWVPKALVPLAIRGIAAECAGMLGWVVDSEKRLPAWLVDFAGDLEG